MTSCPPPNLMSTPITRARWLAMKRKRSSSTQEEPSPSKVPKASWNDYTTRTLLEVMIEEIHEGNRVNGHINSEGWRNIVLKFHMKTGHPYTKVQLRNRSNLIRKLYGKWRKLNDRATGLGVDPRTGALLASEEWWNDVAQGDPEVLKWKTAPPKFLDLMTECYGGNVATGEDTYYPSYCRGGGTFRAPPRPAPTVLPVEEVPPLNPRVAEATASNLVPPGGSSPSCVDSARHKRTRAGTSKPSTGDRMAASIEDYVGVQRKKNELLTTIITGSDDVNEVDHAMSLVHRIEGIDVNTIFYLDITKILKVRLHRHFYIKYISVLDHEMQKEWFRRFM